MAKPKRLSTYGRPRIFQSDDTLRCVFQRTRPPHRSTLPDLLPFASADAARSMFADLGLPASYFQIADGAPAAVSSHIGRGNNDQAVHFEFIAHCISYQGDWSFAVSHHAATMSTSVFWSVDDKVDSRALVDDLRDLQTHACHPMLIPSIMLSAVFQMAIQRLHSLKSRFSKLEDAISSLRYSTLPVEDPPALDYLFELLESCRKDQTSRKGRYEYWESFHAAIEAGLAYYSALPDHDKRIHSEVKQWVRMIWRRLESVKARDKDHVLRVDNVSALLENLVQHREIRLQSSIARASRRDSKDMKFVTLLGSIFLPASLVATILNVPEFQLADGRVLFGAYMGITLPFIALVVVLCMTRPRWARWIWSRMRTPVVRGSKQTGRDKLELPKNNPTTA